MNEERKIFSLSTVLNRVQTVFDDYMSGKFFWIKVELSKVNFDRKGHLYLELIENKGGVTMAKCRGTIWKRNVDTILQALGDAQKDILKDGAEVLCCCEVVFSPVYGFSVNIVDIDLAYSLGEVERKKQATLEQLQKLGLLTQNAKLDLPIVIQRIALIGSVGTSGYQDFVHQLKHNQQQFVYHIHSFDCRVQGESAALEIGSQLQKINKDEFDVVVIIRGGGSKFDLDIFNDFDLASSIANSELCVLTGIGHETDSTVADFVAHSYFKTPSAVAAFIVERTLYYYANITSYYKDIVELCNRKRILSQHQLDITANAIKNKAIASIQIDKNRLQIATTKVLNEVRDRVSKEQHILSLASQVISYQPKVSTRKKQQELEERSRMIALLSKTVVQQQKQYSKANTDILKFYCKSSIKKERLHIEQIQDMLALFDVSTMLKKGFAIVRLNTKTVNEYTDIEEGDVLEIEVYNKVFEITVKNSKEIHKWKNLLMNEHLVN